LTVNEDSFGRTRYPIADSNRATYIENIRIRDPIFLQEARSIASRILKINAKKDNSLPLSLYTLPHGLQKRGFLHARRTGRIPDINHHRSPFKVCQGDSGR